MPHRTRQPRNATYRARRLRAEATPAESILWQLLRNRSLGAKFRRQHPLGGYFADFYCHDAGLVIELDGSAHDSPSAQANDAQRDRMLRLAGLRVVRLRNELVLEHPETALQIISRALNE
jgi:imidazole glycerol-phosphate synthase subunit HisF